MERTGGRDGETSVVISLAELQRLAAERVAEEREASRRAQEAAARAKAEAAARAAAEAEARRKAIEEERERAEMRQRMFEAKIDAAKQAQIEAHKLTVTHELQLQSLAKQREYDLAMAEVQAKANAKPRGRGALIATVVTAAALLFGTVGFLGFVQPKHDAQAAIERARSRASSTDLGELAAAQEDLDLATIKDGTNAAIAPLRQQIAEHRAMAEQIARDAEAKRVAALAAAAAPKPVEVAQAVTPDVKPTPKPAPTVKPIPTPIKPPPSTWGANCTPAMLAKGIPGCR
jgi:hypothetical protein